MNDPRFEVFASRDGWRWRLKAANGRTLAVGEAHSRKRDATRATRTVMQTVLAIRFPMTALVKNTKRVMR